jgi:hypothetical protein
VICVDTLRRLLAGDKGALRSAELLLTAPDGKALIGKDGEQAHVALTLELVICKPAAAKAAADEPAAHAEVIRRKA